MVKGRSGKEEGKGGYVLAKQRLLFIGLVLINLGISSKPFAYELATHARLTRIAYDRSVLVERELLRSLGLESLALNPDGSLALNPFGDSYYDVSGNTVALRQADPNGVLFDVKFMGLADPAQRFTLSAWMMRGAIREDDAFGEDNPQDDPDPANARLRRPLHHFFDPFKNRGLEVPGIGLIDNDIHTAPAWGLGTTNANAFSPPHTPEVNRRNHFSLFDAREAMYRALTGKKADSDDPFAATKEGRNKYWATTFRALGDVVHLVQDMGQPQHTRNDPHAGKFPESLTGHASMLSPGRASQGVYEFSGFDVVPPSNAKNVEYRRSRV
ncbi:MAG: hypothetical protein A2W18_01170 [Candidatus Muproteobacteria bacterium RBG_16_60_9]|uniref:Uncharacterized protein n=1 Tax=Candidatus Muproteobacteria bacterium RBG_16_60_9 TaxID=1817755 RepID=A0A1F6VFI3_9PROT|nr:MAG: hypothetical protein A2W18_01170 [Candidatus Muproteobacteria bacterium RBG_16_60_9]